MKITPIFPFCLAIAIGQAVPLPVAAQITATVNDANTLVSQSGNTFQITGGIQAGANLFHSFQQFGLTQGQIAHFLSHPSVQNILGRVTGGEASRINGLIRVTGAPSNLYLMNPAGMVFGADARLDVSGSFTATTAHGIGLGQSVGGTGYWFNAVGTNDYGALTGSPTAFVFTSPNAGVVVNAGNLAVGQGQSLNLIAGSVINTGTLTAPAGQVTLVAVPGTGLVRFSQPGSLLSFDIVPLSPDGWISLGGAGVPPAATTPPPTLAQLLTGGNLTHATGLTVNADGTVQLVGAGAIAPNEAGVAVTTNRIDVSGPVGGVVEIQAGKVGMWGTIAADAWQTGNGGRAIAWADQTTGFLGTITARGGSQSGNGGFVEVSARQNLAFAGIVDVGATNGRLGTLLLDPTDITIVAGSNALQDALLPTVLATEAPAATFTLSQTALQSQIGTVIVAATNNITLTPGVSLNFVAGGGAISFQADADRNGLGRFVMSPTDEIRTNGRDLTISGASAAVGRITTFVAGPNTSNFIADDLRFPAVSGNVTIATTGDLSVQRLFGRDISLTSENGNIFTGSISSEAAFFGPGSAVRLTAPNGAISLQGFIRAGQTNKTTDSTIAITAAQFRATNPLVQVIESNSQGSRIPVAGDFQRVAMSLYAYPANVDAGGDNAPRRVGTGQVVIQVGDVPLATVGSGNTLIQIRLLRDTTFTIGSAAFTGSGTAGTIAIGAERAPSAIVLLRDNEFSSTIPIAGTLLEQVQETAGLVNCQPAQREQADPLLDISAITPSPATEFPLPEGSFPTSSLSCANVADKPGFDEFLK